MKTKLRLLTVLLVLIAIVGCSTVEDRARWSADPTSWRSRANEIDIVLEFKDDGSLHYPDAAKSAINAIRAVPESENLIVVVFAHGWNHNASSETFDMFDRAIKKLRSTLQEQPYNESRIQLTNVASVTVVSVYVGWRGLEYTPWIPANVPFTFWSRKSAAERVGEGPLRGFMQELNDIYRERNALPSKGGKRPFMGLAAFGHSFGGQVIFGSVRSILEGALSSSSPDRPISGFGDIVVLLNPAVEARQFESLHKASREAKYHPWQTPLVAILSGTADFPNRFFFSLGRRLDSRYSSIPDDERETWRNAVGAQQSFVTHTLSQNKGDTAPPDAFDPRWYSHYPCEVLDLDIANVRRFRAGAGDKAQSLRLRPEERAPLRSPMVVAVVDEDVVGGHSDIWFDINEAFLTNFVALSQGKAMVRRAGTCTRRPLSSERVLR